LFNWLPQPTTADDQGGGVSSRDERTFTQRFAIWDAALGIISDYPLTGGGMASFRYGAVRDVYPVIGMDVAPPGDEATFNPRPRPPHAHNEFVHIATDLGIPGLIVFTAWYVVTAYMLWVCWQSGDYNARVVAVAVGGGLLAHIGYGMGDAIPLWDRFSFLLFMLFGLAAGQYVLVRQNNVAMDEQATQSNQYLTS
jgi:O-antigen ligase